MVGLLGGWISGQLDDWTVGPFDYNLIQMDDYPADSCAISPTAFFFFKCKLLLLNVSMTCA